MVLGAVSNLLRRRKDAAPRSNLISVSAGDLNDATAKSTVTGQNNRVGDSAQVVVSSPKAAEPQRQDSLPSWDAPSLVIDPPEDAPPEPTWGETPKEPESEPEPEPEPESKSKPASDPEPEPVATPTRGSGTPVGGAVTMASRLRSKEERSVSRSSNVSNAARTQLSQEELRRITNKVVIIKIPDGRELSTYLSDEGYRYYADVTQDDWVLCPSSWEMNAEFVRVDEGTEQMEVYYAETGEQYQTYVDASGQRFYCDLEDQKWLPFPDEWLSKGTIAKDDSDVDASKMGSMVYNGVTYQTYIAQVPLDHLYYMEQGTGEWVEMPLDWLTDEDRQKFANGFQQGQRGSGGGGGGGAGSLDVIELQEKLEEALNAKGRIEKSYQEELEEMRGRLRHGSEDGELSKLTSELRERKQENKRLEDTISDLQTQLQTQRDDAQGGVAKQSKEIEDLREELAEAKKAFSLLQDSQAKQEGALEQQLAKARKEKEARHEKLMAQKDEELAALEKKLETIKNAHYDNVRQLKSEHEDKMREAQQAYNELATKSEVWEREIKRMDEFEQMAKDATEKMQKAKADLDEFLVKYRAEAAKRRALYNKLQEINGNIRVYMRCRILNSKEKKNNEKFVIGFPDEDACTITDSKGQVKSFEFDRVYGPEAQQQDVFLDTEPLITSCVDGYNVCLFAYGQTGSGKTYTMMGVDGNRGVNFRSLDELFKITVERAEDYEISIAVSFLEIYNETIRDLLVPKSPKLEIRQGPAGNHVPGLTSIPVRRAQDVLDVIETGEKNRSVASTAMNAHSSRSHSILQVTVSTKNKFTNVTTTGKLTLVDLAGSERVSKSEATGERLVEAASINTSLSALGNCIAGLTSGNSHVPFRNSKLTYLLQDSLGGDSKTLMFLNVGPAASNVDESLSSLQFGSRVRAVHLGKASKQVAGAPGKGKKGPPKLPPRAAR